MTPRQLYVDLDHTLFRTHQFSQQLWRCLAQWYPTVEVSELFRQRLFYVRPAGQQSEATYDFVAHVRQLGLDPARVVRRLQQSPLADGRFQHQGVMELRQQLQARGQVTILTYGEAAYQQLKLALCPALVGVPLYSTLQPKAIVLRQQSTTAERWLIDDKPLGDEVPAGVHVIQVLLEGQPEPVAVTWPVVRQLSGIPALIDRLGESGASR